MNKMKVEKIYLVFKDNTRIFFDNKKDKDKYIKGLKDYEYSLYKRCKK